MPDPYTSCAKQILRGKQHVADCRDPETAEALAIVLNHAQIVFAPEVSMERMEFVKGVLWG